MTTTVLVVGATGSLGSTIAHHLTADPFVSTRLLVRDASPSDPGRAAILEDLRERGAEIVIGDLADAASLDAATAGVDVVVSAVQGGRDVIVDGQIALARAAAANGVQRFVPSDFALDMWAAPEDAPMFALRREADAAIEETGIAVLHVLNGAFMDMMLDPRTAGVVDLEAGTGNVTGSGDDEFDVTLTEDVARFTARLAADPDATAGTYRISGSRTSFSGIIAAVEAETGRTLERVHRGGVDDLRATIDGASNPWAAIGAWYNLSMLTTPPFSAVDNDRYPEVRPRSFEAYLREVLAAAARH